MQMFSVVNQPPRKASPWKQRKKIIKVRLKRYLKRQTKKKHVLNRFCRKHVLNVWLKQIKSLTPRQSWNVYTLLSGPSSTSQTQKESEPTLWEIMQRSIHPTKYFTDVIVTSSDLPKQEHYSDAYECPECGKRKVMYTQVQIRSADEGMTSFLTCVECKHRWTEN